MSYVILRVDSLVCIEKIDFERQIDLLRGSRLENRSEGKSHERHIN